VLVDLGIEHAPYYNVNCGLFGSAVFFHIISLTDRLWKTPYWT